MILPQTTSIIPHLSYNLSNHQNKRPLWLPKVKGFHNFTSQSYSETQKNIVMPPDQQNRWLNIELLYKAADPEWRYTEQERRGLWRSWHTAAMVNTKDWRLLEQCSREMEGKGLNLVFAISWHFHGKCVMLNKLKPNRNVILTNRTVWQKTPSATIRNFQFHQSYNQEFKRGAVVAEG